MGFFKKSCLVVLITLFSSCYKLDYLEQPNLELEWNPEFAIPLLEKTLTIDSWVENLPFEDLPFAILQLFGKIELQDTIPINLMDLSTDEITINTVNFNFYMVNKYGATVGGQAYFVRNDFSMIDSVFQDGLIELPAAHIGTMTDIWVPFPKRVETEYDTETFEIIINESRFIIIKYMIDISTLNETDLSYFPDQSIEVNLGVKIDFTRLITVK